VDKLALFNGVGEFGEIPRFDPLQRGAGFLVSGVSSPLRTSATNRAFKAKAP
jgi:hypothetical protein